MTIRLSSLPSKALLALALFACGADAETPAPSTPLPEIPAPPPEDKQIGCEPDHCAEERPPTPAAPPSVHVRFLGVAGFLVEHEGEAFMSAPLFTRPNMIEVTAGFVDTDESLVEQNLTKAELAKVHAVLSGHAHYDHLLDASSVLTHATNATLYSNRSAKNVLAAWAPDRGPACAGTPAQAKTIDRARVIAMDDPTKSTVDYRGCPNLKPEGAPLEGKWVEVPNSNIRVLAVCSEHPDQIGPVHYAPGDVAEEQCAPPRRADQWKEGATLAFLVDFLDPKTKAPVFRTYYQDAPTSGPIGHVPPSFLVDRPVDLALLCIGAYGNVEGAPTKTLDALKPRYAIGGHWEDFFQSTTVAPQPIPLLDLTTWKNRAALAMPPDAAIKPMKHNGKDADARTIVPMPGDSFDLTP